MEQMSFIAVQEYNKNENEQLQFLILAAVFLEPSRRSRFLLLRDCARNKNQ